jgi:hypoxanthine phosphoribosyltransferase
VTDALRCELVTLDEVYELAFEVAGRVRDARFEPDVVVAVARGGFVPARLLCDFLGVHASASLRIRHYAGGAQREEQAHLAHPLGPELAAEVGGRRVLLVDDVNDSGETLALARAELASLDPAELKLAVLHEKSTTRERADFRARSVEHWHWILYQWALVEDCVGFAARMEPPAASAGEVRERLDEELGLALSDALWEKVRGSLELP